MPPPLDTGYAACPSCGRSSRAVIRFVSNERQVHYVATAKPAQFVKDTFSIRPDQQDWLRAGSNKSERLRRVIDAAMKDDTI